MDTLTHQIPDPGFVQKPTNSCGTLSTQQFDETSEPITAISEGDNGDPSSLT
jgi:hypothetical protein